MLTFEGMPDSLSKTIPIWCSVINQFLFPDKPDCHKLYTSPQIISDTEHAQISSLLPTFLAALQALRIPLPELRLRVSKPLRPFWITPDSHLSPTTTVFEDFHPVICCTVSRRVSGGELSEGGYIQGAGDDTENWAYGLTPPVFWANGQLLLSTSEENMPELIETLVHQNSAVYGGVRCVKPTTSIFVGSLSAVPTIADTPTITLLSKITEESTWLVTKTNLEVGLGPHKLGSRSLRTALPTIVGFAENVLLQADTEASPGTAPSIIVGCESGRDLAIGVALALLCLFFDDGGGLQKSKTSHADVDKNFIRRRLGWISTSMPDANPSRATLQSVNSYLMERRF